MSFEKLCLENVKDAKFEKRNAEKLDFKEEVQFDIVIGGAILHHINYEKTLSDLKKWINKDTVIIFRNH